MVVFELYVILMPEKAQREEPESRSCMGAKKARYYNSRNDVDITEPEEKFHFSFHFVRHAEDAATVLQIVQALNVKLICVEEIIISDGTKTYFQLIIWIAVIIDYIIFILGE